MKMLITFAILAVVLPGTLQNAFAQNRADTTKAYVKSTCWQSPNARCQRILVTETGFYHPVLANSRRVIFDPQQASPGTSESFRSLIGWEVGLLRAVGEKSFIGPTLSWGFGDGSTRFGVKLRGRRYVTEGRSAEISGGVIFTRVGRFTEHSVVGFTLDGRLNLKDKIYFIISYDDVNWPDDGGGDFTYVDDVSRGRVLRAGVSLGSIPGGIATAVGGGIWLLWGFLLGQSQVVDD